MAIRTLDYGESGTLLYDDEDVTFYADGKPTRAARGSQIYLEDAPEDDLEVMRKADMIVATWTSLFMMMGA
jgi:hypothetical protein